MLRHGALLCALAGLPFLALAFGDPKTALTIKPFTTDYDNILLSRSLIGDWKEFMAFPDQSTIIANAMARTGGRSYNAADESPIIRVLQGINPTTPGRIDMRRRDVTEQPKFTPYVLAAVILWTMAIGILWSMRGHPS